MALRSLLFRNDPQLEAAAVSDPAHILPGAVGRHVAKIQQALLEVDGALIDAAEVQNSSYGPSTANAVGSFKGKRNIINRSYQSQADNIVGRMTIAALDKELFGRRGLDPKEAAEKAKLISLIWVNSAIFAIQSRIQSLNNRFGPGGIALVNLPQLKIHFHTDRLKTSVTENGALQRLLANYNRINTHLLNSGGIFRTVDDFTAARETRGQFRPGVILGAYTFPGQSVSFTTHFPGLGKNCQAAVIIHELAHFISPLIGHIGGERGPEYDGSDFEKAINNSHCYPNFATHVTPPMRDERFGLSRPND